MKNKDISYEHKITSVEFLITPLSVRVPEYEDGQFSLVLEKGAQILKIFDEKINVVKGQKILKRLEFANGEVAKLRMQSEKNMSCNWVFYRNIDGMQEFLGTVPFSLLDHYLKYLEELKRINEDVLAVAALRREGKNIGQLWNRVKALLNSSKYVDNRKAQFEFEIEFSVEIEHDFDVVTVREERENVIRNMKQKKTFKMDKNLSVQTLNSQSREQQQKQEGQARSSDQLTVIRGNDEQGEGKSTSGKILSDIIEQSNETNSQMGGEKQKKEQVEQMKSIAEQSSQSVALSKTTSLPYDFTGVEIKKPWTIVSEEKNQQYHDDGQKVLKKLKEQEKSQIDKSERQTQANPSVLVSETKILAQSRANQDVVAEDGADKQTNQKHKGWKYVILLMMIVLSVAIGGLLHRSFKASEVEVEKQVGIEKQVPRKKQKGRKGKGKSKK